MSAESQRKRVFVLGAGFSKAAGMPDATELTGLILRADLLPELDDFQDWIKDIGQRIAHLDGGAVRNHPYVPNIEQLFDFAQFDIELWRMKQQELPVGGEYGPDTFEKRADDIVTWLGYMEEHLVKVLIAQQEKADRAKLLGFVNRVQPGDTVLTLNYDTLVEECLRNAGRSWRHGFDVEPPADANVLKLHGSLDWKLTHRDHLINRATLLFKKEDLNIEREECSPDEKEGIDSSYTNVLQRVDASEVSEAPDERRKGSDNWPFRSFALGGLGGHKPLHRLAGSAVVWRNAFDALKQADEIYVVGWSCSPYDRMARFHFASAMRMRKQGPSRTVVIDPDGKNIHHNLAPVFGECTLVCERVENVDWGDLLGREVGVHSTPAQAEACGSGSEKKE